jgi:membrane-associated phospholipid phosphatase
MSSSYGPGASPETFDGPTTAGTSGARVGTVVWGLIVLALAALIIISRLGLVVLNGTYVLIGLMIGAGAALVIGGLLSARRRDKETTTRKS